MGNCSECCTLANPGGSALPFYKVCLLHNGQDPMNKLTTVIKGNSPDISNQNYPNPGSQMSDFQQFSLDAKIGIEKILLSVWAKSFQNENWPGSTETRGPTAFYNKVDFVVVCLAMEDPHALEKLRPGFLDKLHELRHHDPEHSDFEVPVFLLGTNFHGKKVLDEKDITDWAKANNWGFGFCSSLEERNEEIQLLAKITKEIGIGPQNTDPNGQMGELIIESESESIHSMENRGARPRLATSNSIFDDTDLDKKFKKTNTKSDKMMSFTEIHHD